MNSLRIHLPDRRILAGVSIGVLVGVLAVGAVTAASRSPAGPSGAAGLTGGSGTPVAGRAGNGLGPGALRQAIRRNFRLDVTATNRNGTRNVLYVRGTLDVSAGSVTVTLPDRTTQTFTVDSSTVVRDKGETIPYANLANGQRAMVFGTKNADGSFTAKLIRCIREPQGATTTPAAPSASPTR